MFAEAWTSHLRFLEVQHDEASPKARFLSCEDVPMQVRADNTRDFVAARAEERAA
jgi:hypothetical protein